MNGRGGMAIDEAGVERVTIVDPSPPEPQPGESTHPITLADGLTVLAHDAPCAHCGCEIAVTPPWLWTLAGAPHGRAIPSRLTPHQGFGPPSWCLSCRLAGASSSEAKHLIEEDRRVRGLAAAAGMPEGAAIWSIYFSPDATVEPTRWRGWRGRLLAITVADLPPNADQWPGLRALGFPFGELVIFATHLWREGKPGALMFTSNPVRDRETLEIADWETKRTRDLQELMMGTEIYREVVHPRGGRDQGAGRGGTPTAPTGRRDHPLWRIR
jgi:hypothetical protein